MIRRKTYNLRKRRWLGYRGKNGGMDIYVFRDSKNPTSGKKGYPAFIHNYR